MFLRIELLVTASQVEELLHPFSDFQFLISALGAVVCIFLLPKEKGKEPSIPMKIFSCYPPPLYSVQLYNPSKSLLKKVSHQNEALVNARQ